ncbi:MAG: pre-peptidase C-terminal domain-containing protein [Paracoccaceae bacterium]
MTYFNFDFGDARSLPNPETLIFSSASDDYQDNSSTTGSVTVGGSVNGTIEIEVDEDWFAITLAAGQTVTISLTGITLFDPILAVYNASGTLLNYNDDINTSGGIYDSQLVFEATTAGTYYIGALAYPWSEEGYSANTGTYQITVTSGGTATNGGGGGLAGSTSSPTSNPLLMDIDWGTQVATSAGNTINIYFAPSGYSADGYTSEGFNAYEIGQFQLAFDVIESYTNLTFNVVNDPANAHMVVVLDTNEVLGEFLGYFNPPGTYNQGVGVFDGTSWDRTAGGDLERGGYGFVTIVHELLHGLGLAHPHDTGGTSTVMGGVTSAFDSYGTYQLNQGVFTVMTYNSGWHTGPSGTGPFTSGSYGFEGGPMAIDIAALQENYGANTTYNNGNNTYTLPTVNATGTFFTAIWDTGGTDTITNAGSSLAANIDLRAATIVEATGGGGWVSSAAGIAGGFTIANGVVIENATGGNGNDILTGNEAANSLIGNGGNDSVFGDAGNDRLLGGTGDDTLDGGAGRDRLVGDAGADLMNGGTEQDTLLGSAGNDTMNGGDGNDVLRGGNDHDLQHGNDGNDIVIGGTGRDTLFGDGNDDTLRGNGGFDTVNGGNGNDFVAGGAQADLVLGSAGNDTCEGGGGFDTIDGGTGDDVLTGNFNADQFVFADGHGDDTITDFEATNNAEKIDLSAVSAITSLADLNLGSATSGAPPRWARMLSSTPAAAIPSP